MKFWKSQPSRFSLYLYLMLSIVCLLVVSFVVLAYGQAKYERALENRMLSIRLAEELRQSSNDLTRLVRAYVTTGNPAFKEQFQAVIDIRDGNRPRPLNYSLAYWDFKAIKAAQQPDATEAQGDAVPLLELMRKAGVTDSELENLKKSKASSDTLVHIEHQAMALIEEDSPTNPLKREKALKMLVDDHFLSIKAEVMQPIVLTEGLITQRTQAAVNEAQLRLKMAITSLFVFGALLVVLIVKLRQQLQMIIGCSIPELQKTIANLGSGDFVSPIEVDQGRADSVLGWIAQTQRKLAELDLMHIKAIVDSSDDAIISKTMQGIIASWNHGAEKIFGYTANDMLGKPMQTIIPDDRQHEEPEILARIARGEKVDHFETQRRHRDGHLVDVSVTISPVYDPKGRVIGASKIARDISKAKAAEAEIHRLAFYDTLTGLANRRLLMDRLHLTLAKATRDKTSFAVLFLDLDNFKSLNDTQGHEAGDVLLKEVAKRLNTCVRESDTVARFGGDEFVMILNSKHENTEHAGDWVEAVTQKIITSLALPYQILDISHACTTSVGAAVYTGQPCTASDLLKQADQAMYEAKYAGKNGYRIFKPSLEKSGAAP